MECTTHAAGYGDPMLPPSIFGDGGAHVFGASDLAVFLLANAIICAICGPRVWAEFRTARAKKP